MQNQIAVVGSAPGAHMGEGIGPQRRLCQVAALNTPLQSIQQRVSSGLPQHPQAPLPCALLQIHLNTVAKGSVSLPLYAC